MKMRENCTYSTVKVQGRTGRIGHTERETAIGGGSRADFLEYPFGSFIRLQYKALAILPVLMERKSDVTSRWVCQTVPTSKTPAGSLIIRSIALFPTIT